MNGQWSTWGEWGACSETCGPGTQTKSRTCTNPAPQAGGDSCPGTSTESKECNLKVCPGTQLS